MISTRQHQRQPPPKDSTLMTLDEYLAQIEAQWLEGIEAKDQDLFDEESLFEECCSID